MSEKTSYTLSEIIHSEFGLVTGCLFDQFVTHLCQNHKVFISATFYSQDNERFYTIEKEGYHGGEKSIGLNMKFLTHLMQHKQWPQEFHKCVLTYQTKSAGIKNVTFSIQPEDENAPVEDINSQLKEVVINT
jgi:hypothetical protein